jgi:hypothetical protein
MAQGMTPDLERAQSEPVVVSLEGVEIPKGEALKRLGYPSGSYTLEEPVRSMFAEAVREAGRLMEPKASYRISKIASNDGEEVRFGGTGFSIKSRQVAKLLDASAYAVCFATTVGLRLDESISEHMKRGDMLFATLLDAIGSETADAGADRLHWGILASSAKASDGALTARFSPGYGDWPVTVQADMIKTSGGGLIGISVTPSSLMIPRKSISAVFGLILR